MPSVTLKSPNISCHHCVRTIEHELTEIPGIRRVKADAATQTVVVDWELPATIGQIAERLREINYPAEG